ncbi:MAG: ABC transporter ATP-binding protein [Isosphaeraceae bacterium]|nr:ABC transporter ATP-binding protein [Isosphaeraceae bacterium]
MLEAIGLTKIYAGRTPALAGLDLAVPPGEVFCLLGPNGAGKTTTVNLFLDFIRPTSGKALVGGVESRLDPRAARRKLAYIPENVMLHGRLTGLENLEYFAALASGFRTGRDELASLLRKAGLPDEAIHRRVSTYSKGMRQKVGVAVALAKRAQALLLDEPTSGLDPLSANEFAGLIDELRREGMAILMVTHDLFLAHRCGDRVGIMIEGRMVHVLEPARTDHLGLERAYLEASRKGRVA